MTRGLDFRQGGLVPQERMRSPIFDYTYDPNSPHYIYSPTGRPDLRFKVPRQVTITSTNSHVEQTNSSLFTSYEQTIKVDIGGFNFGIGIESGKFGLGANYAREYGRIQERLRTEYKATTRGLYYTSAYSVIAMPYPFMPLNSVFKMTLDYLASTPRTPQEIEMYKVFLDYFGGFFSWQAVFGGQIRQFHFLNRKLTESRDVNWIKEQLSLSFRYNLFNISAGGHRNRTDIRINNFFTENSLGELVFTGGIRALQRNDTLKEWDRSIDDEPSLLHGQFRPLSDLISNEPVKKANLESIIKKYSQEGVVALPPAAALINNLPKVPGYQVIGSGFDPVYMQTRLPIFEHDSHGFERSSVWTNPFYPQHQFSVPSTMSIRTRTESHESNYTDAYMTKNEFEFKYSHRSTSKFALGFGKRTREVFFYLHRFEQLAEAKITVEKQITWYDLTLSPMLYFNPELQAKYMNPHLKYIIDHMLGTDYSKPEVRAIYRSIIEYWGTDLVIGGELGGSAKSDIFFKRDLLRSHIIDIVKTTSSFSFLGFINSNNYNFRNDTRIAQWFKENVQIENTWRGGRYRPRKQQLTESTKTPWQEFVETLRTDPEVMKYNIVPISVIIRDPVKKELMNKAIEEYRAEIVAKPMNQY